MLCLPRPLAGAPIRAATAPVRAATVRERWSLSPVCPNNRPHPVRYHFLMRTVTLPVLISLFVLQARPANNFALTVDNIMRGPALVGYEPTAVRWSPMQPHPLPVEAEHRQGNRAHGHLHRQPRRQWTPQTHRRRSPPASPRPRRNHQRQAPHGLLQRRRSLYPRQHHRQGHPAHQDHRRRNQSPLHPGWQTHFLHPQRQPLRDVAG